MEVIGNLLQKIEWHLKNSNANICSKLQSGLRRDYIEKILADAGINKDDDLIALYEWKNGIQYNSGWVIGEIDFFSRGLLISLEDMVDTRRILYENDILKDPLLLPLFTDGSGEYLLYNAGKSNKPGQLLLDAPSLLLSGEPQSMYDSLTSLCKTVIECYNSKAYVFNNGELEIDYDLEWEISETLNPLSAYWKNKNIF